MGHYKSNLRDIEFALFEVLERDRLFGQHGYDEVDLDTARALLAEVDRLARADLAASYEDGDRNPPVYDPETRSVTIPILPPLATDHVKLVCGGSARRPPLVKPHGTDIT